MRVRAAKYSVPSSRVQTMTTIDLPDAANRSEVDRLEEREVAAYGDDDIIDVEYTEDDGDDNVSRTQEQSTLTPPQAHDEFSRDDRVARYQKMMSGWRLHKSL